MKQYVGISIPDSLQIYSFCFNCSDSRLRHSSQSKRFSTSFIRIFFIKFINDGKLLIKAAIMGEKRNCKMIAPKKRINKMVH